MATAETETIGVKNINISFTADVLRPAMGAEILEYKASPGDTILVAPVNEIVQLPVEDQIQIDAGTEIVEVKIVCEETVPVQVQQVQMDQVVIDEIHIDQLTEVICPVTAPPEDIVITTGETLLIGAAPPADMIELRQPIETIDMEVTYYQQSYGAIPFIYANPIDNRVVLDISQSQAFKIPCRVLPDWSMLTIDVIHWPPDSLAEIFILLEDVPGTTRILWPGFDRGVRAPINKDVDNEYLLRSWDGGQTLTLERLATYRTIK